MRSSTLPSSSSIIDTLHIWRNCTSFHIDQIKFVIKGKVKKSIYFSPPDIVRGNVVINEFYKMIQFKLSQMLLL